jgi:hypothetical protein
VSIRAAAIIADHGLSIMRDMGGDAGNEVQVIHLHPPGIALPILAYDLRLGKIE